MKHIAKLLVFAMLLSLLCIGGTALAANDYVGTWRYDDYYIWFTIDSDDIWEEYIDDGLILDGYCETIGGSMYLCFPDGSIYREMTLEGSVMTDEDGDTLSRSQMPEIDSDPDLYEFTGVWQTGTGDDACWILLYPGGTYAAYNEDEFLSVGYTRVDSLDRILLLESSYDDDSDAILTLAWMEGALMSDTNECFTLGLLPFDHDTVLYTMTLDSPYFSSDYVGVWEYYAYDLWIEVDADGTWSIFTSDGRVTGGSCYGGDNCLYLQKTDGTLYDITFISLDNGVMTDSDDDYLFRSELPDF